MENLFNEMEPYIKNIELMAIADKNFVFGEKVRGLSIEGTCIPLSGSRAKKAFELYKERFPKSGNVMSEDLLTRPVESFSKNEVIHRIWKVTPSRIKIFDETKFGDSGKEFSQGASF